MTCLRPILFSHIVTRPISLLFFPVLCVWCNCNWTARYKSLSCCTSRLLVAACQEQWQDRGFTFCQTWRYVRASLVPTEATTSQG
eukprot:2024108-Ditylum_brightwellii.AAC.1